jgi:hypothetical protein
VKGNSFAMRAEAIWNSLPDHIVTADSVNCFKNRLDTFWDDQELMYENHKLSKNFFTGNY